MLTLFNSLFCSFNFCKSLGLSFRFSSTILTGCSVESALADSTFSGCGVNVVTGAVLSIATLVDSTSFMISGISGSEFRRFITCTVVCFLFLISKFLISSRLHRNCLRIRGLQIINRRFVSGLVVILCERAEPRKFILCGILESVNNLMKSEIEMIRIDKISRLNLMINVNDNRQNLKYKLRMSRSSF